MDRPVERGEEPQEREVSPSEVWEQLSPDLQARITNLLARMACKYALSQRMSVLVEKEAGGEIHSHES
jgi:hypothetical protein